MISMIVGLITKGLAKYGVQLLAIIGSFRAGQKSAQLKQTKRSLRDAKTAAESDRRVRAGLAHGERDRLRAKWTRGR